MGEAHTGYTPNERSRKIVICRRCDGRGHFDHEVANVHPHKGERIGRTRRWREDCACCEGSGRVVMTLTFEPYHDGISGAGDGTRRAVPPFAASKAGEAPASRSGENLRKAAQ